jgi:hypothetical protein
MMEADERSRMNSLPACTRLQPEWGICVYCARSLRLSVLSVAVCLSSEMETDSEWLTNLTKVIYLSRDTAETQLRRRPQT